MRATARRLFASATSGGGPNANNNNILLRRPDQLALLPPIPLYRRLLRAHRRHLPQEMRLLGDEYVKAEFRAHRNVDNPAHMIGFLTEWQLYAQKIEGDSWIGEKLDPHKIEKMSDQQIGQLYELMRTIRKQSEEGGGGGSGEGGSSSSSVL